MAWNDLISNGMGSSVWINLIVSDKPRIRISVSEPITLEMADQLIIQLNEAVEYAKGLKVPKPK